MRRRKILKWGAVCFLSMTFAISSLHAQLPKAPFPGGFPKTLDMNNILNRDDLITNLDPDQVQRSRIASLTVWQFDLTSGKGPKDVTESEGVKLFTASYDEKGKEIDRIVFGAGGDVVQKISIDYDSSGFVRESLVYTYLEEADTTLNQHIIYEYTPQHILMNISSYDMGRNMVTLKIDYIYSDNGNVVESRISLGDGLVNMKTEYAYDDEGRIQETVVRNEGEGTTVVRSTFEYDSNGWEITNRGPDGAIVERTRNGLDERGNVREVIDYDSGDRVRSRIDRRYNSEGKMIEMTSSMPAANLSTKTTYAYNEDGNVIEQIIFNKLNEPVTLFKYEYVFHE